MPIDPFFLPPAPMPMQDPREFMGRRAVPMPTIQSPGFLGRQPASMHATRVGPGVRFSVSPRTQMLADLLEGNEPTPQQRIDSAFAAIDPLAGRARKLPAGSFPAPAAPPPAAVPTPVGAATSLAPLPVAPASTAAPGLSFLQRNGFLQRDPNTGEYLDPQLAAIANEWMRGT